MKKTFLALALSIIAFVPIMGATVPALPEGNDSSIEFIFQGVNSSNSAQFEFDSFEQLAVFDLSIIDELMPAVLEDCSVTATVTVSHTLGMEGNVGVASTGHQTTITVSATVTASCSEIKSVVKALIADLRAQLGL